MPDPLVDAINRLRADVDDLLGREWPRYAEGTWTPAFTGTATAGVYTYSSQIGHYRVIGNLVFIWGDLQITAIGTPPAGSMTISGLPYTSESTAGNLASVYFGLIGNFNYTAAALQLVGDIANGTAAIRLHESFDNGANVAAPAANFTNVNCHLEFAGFYQKA